MKETEINVPRALGSGLAAGSAFLVTIWADSKLSSHPFNDLKLVGQVITTKSPVWQIQGIAGHFGFSFFLAMLYARYIYRILPGPPVLKGVLFLQIENALLYPVAPLVDKIHAGMKAGEVPPLMNWKTFWGQALRHLAFGAVLGALYRAEAGGKGKG